MGSKSAIKAELESVKRKLIETQVENKKLKTVNLFFAIFFLEPVLVRKLGNRRKPVLPIR